MPRRILIVRLSAIGDTIHSIPLAAALKRLWPDCFLGWVTEKPSEELVAANPVIDWHYALPKGWLKSPSAAWAMRRAVRKHEFTTVFDPQGLTKSAVVASFSGAGVRVGFTRGEARELAPILENRLVTPTGTHAVDRTLSLLRGIGETPPPEGSGEFVLPGCGVADWNAIGMATRGLEKGFVLLGPWGSFESKRWPLVRFRDLAGLLYTELGLPSLMLGHGMAERGPAGEMCGGSLALAPDVGVAGVVELCRRARLFVGCDSFPMHAAAAVGCRTLGLFGVTDPARLGPYGRRGKFVFERLTLPRSTRERRGLGQENMLALTVEKVFGAAADLVGTTLRPHP